MKLSVIIPSAIRVSPEMEVDFGPIPPALVPIGGKVVAERIFERYANQEVSFYIAIEDNAEFVEEHFEFFPDPRVHLVRVGKTISIGHTLAKIFELRPEAAEGPLVLNFADTIVEDLPDSAVGHDFISYASTIESQRWTLFKQKDGRITELSDKEFQLDPTSWMMLLGVWGFESGAAYRDVLLSKSPEENKHSFYEAMIAYYNGLPKPASLIESSNYVDCGHADNYYAARRRLINARFFNSLKFNEMSGTIRKTSGNREKLVDEIHWLQAIPKELKSCTPAVYDYSKDPLEPFVEMEFYSYPSLDESFVSARFDFDAWEKLFDKVFSLIRIAGKYTVSDPALTDDLREMYLDKTLSRLDAIDKTVLDQSLWNDKLVIDGQECAGISRVREGLETALNRRTAFATNEFQVIHGDMCLGNILYDAKHCLIKLIDARGRFGRYDIYGDVHYDLAKLSHSILGYYDFIMSDRFKVEKDEQGGYVLRCKTSPYHATVGQIFQKYLRQEGFDLDRVRLIESLLFLSMVPLHKDRPERQLPMLLRGLGLFQAHAGNQ